MSDDNREFTMEAIIANDKKRQDLIDKVFGGKGSDKGAITAPQAPVKDLSESTKLESVREKHLKIRNDVMNIILENGYDRNDQNIQAIVANFMANIGRLRY
jgi:hypothetical protein